MPDGGTNFCFASMTLSSDFGDSPPSKVRLSQVFYNGSMFTGIIEQTGTLVSLVDRGGVRRITIEAPGIASRLREGDSLGVSGVCLTALDVDPVFFHADLAQETLEKTSLGFLAAGAKVNLELPTAAGSPLGGHVVQGHVDGRGALASLTPVKAESDPAFDPNTTDWTLKVRVPENVRQWMVPKGSVAVEGISLTIADFDGEEITIAILPLTYWRTNLHTLKIGAPVNVEADVLVKLASMQLKAEKKPELELTEAWLVANGY
jgi:riboflavin synthase